MKDIEKIGEMLKQFIADSMVEANKLEEEIKQKKLERDAKDEEIEDVNLQLDYIAMLKLQLEEKLELLEQEREMIHCLVLEKEEEAKKNRLENILDEIVTNDGEEVINEGK